MAAAGQSPVGLEADLEVKIQKKKPNIYPRVSLKRISASPKKYALRKTDIFTKQ